MNRWNHKEIPSVNHYFSAYGIKSGDGHDDGGVLVE